MALFLAAIIIIIIIILFRELLLTFVWIIYYFIMSFPASELFTLAVYGCYSKYSIYDWYPRYWHVHILFFLVLW